MKTLKEIIERYDGWGVSDKDIIKAYIAENELEDEYLGLIPELAEKKMQRVNAILQNARSWIPQMPDPLIENDEARDKVKRIIQHHLLGMDLANSSTLYKWAKEQIPKMKLPTIIYLPVLTYLQNYGIEFKMTEKERKALKDGGHLK